MDQVLDGLIRTYTIKRSHHLGYGFVAGHEAPTMVKMIEPGGPSYKRLLPGDIIMAVNGINVENASREEITKMIQLSGDQIKIEVRQPTYEELIRAKNLGDSKFYGPHKSTGITSTTTSYLNNRSLPPNPSPLNRLVTSISQQQNQRQQYSPNSTSYASDTNDHANGATPPVQIRPISKDVLKQRLNNGVDHDSKVNSNNTRTLGRAHPSYGRHSPLPERSKSSMDAVRIGNANKKTSGADNGQPLLKRSNTMRPSRKPTKAIDTTPPAKVMELFSTVTKIFFEVGQTRVLPYSQDTTVGTILESLNSRLIGNSPNSEQIKRYFGLAVTIGVDSDGASEQVHKRKLLHILDESDSIRKIRELPYSTRLRLLYRMVDPPSDVNALYTQEKIAFEYLYQQSCNDLKLERFKPELDQDTALKLSALRVLEYVHSNHSKSHGNSKDPKVYIKLVKKTPGIEYFLPASMVDTMIDKRGKRIVAQYKKLRAKLTEQIRKNFEEFDFEPPTVKSTTNLDRYSSTSFHELSLPEMKSSPRDYIKLLFLNYLSQLPCYGNFKRPTRASTSPAEANSVGDRSSSLESVPRTSESSPLIKHNRDQNNNTGRLDNPPVSNNISRLAQINSMRSLNSTQSSSMSQPVDRNDIPQTPSIESISSITFNMQNSPSPQQASHYLSQQGENYPAIMKEPSPMPRQQMIAASKPQDYNSIEKLYSQRYTINDKLEELLRNVKLPPPPPCSIIYNYELPYHLANKIDYRATKDLTRVLTDTDIEKLRVPPPPRMIN